MVERFVDHGAPGTGRPPQIVALAAALTDREADVLQHGKPAEQLIDLESPRDAPPRPPGLREPRDVLAVEQHPAGRGSERAVDQIDESGLAGAVRPDQRPPGATLQGEIYVARDLERAEVAIEVLHLERGRGHGFLLKYRLASSAIPSSPRRANNTVSTSRRPMPNCQKAGLSFARLSSRIM